MVVERDPIAPAEGCSRVSRNPRFNFVRNVRAGNLNEAQRRGSIDGMGTTARRQLREDAFRVRLDGLGSDGEVARDRLVRQAAAHQEQDRPFARRQACAYVNWGDLGVIHERRLVRRSPSVVKSPSLSGNAGRTIAGRRIHPMADGPIVYVIDDDPSMRNAIEDLLQSMGLGVRVFPSAQEFLKATRTGAPGCIVLDVRLPGQSGLDFQRQISGTAMELPIVFITGHGDVPMSVRAMKSGAVEFLTKPFRDQELIDAIHAALERDRARRADAGAVAGLRARIDALTPRGRQVRLHVVSWRLYKPIAASLQLSPGTAAKHPGQLL